MLFLYFLFCSIMFAEDTTLRSDNNKNMSVYITMPHIKNVSEETDGTVGIKSVFGYNNTYWRNAKVPKPGYENLIWEPITMHRTMKLYDKDTIKYAWDNCDYEKDAKKCANLNGNMLIETYITIDKYETVVQMILYYPDMSIANISTVSDRGEVNYIKQQEIQMRMTSSALDVRILPEEKPLEWVIPAHLLDGYILQAAAGLWMGVKLQ